MNEPTDPNRPDHDDELVAQLASYADAVDRTAATHRSNPDVASTGRHAPRRRMLLAAAAAIAVIAGVTAAYSLSDRDGGYAIDVTPPGDVTDLRAPPECPGHPFDPEHDRFTMAPTATAPVASYTIRTDPAGNLPGVAASTEDPGVRRIEILYPLRVGPRTDPSRPVTPNACDPLSAATKPQLRTSNVEPGSAYLSDGVGNIVEIPAGDADLGNGIHLGIYGTPAVTVDELLYIAEQLRWEDASSASRNPDVLVPTSGPTTKPNPADAPDTSTTTSTVPLAPADTTPITFDGIGRRVGEVLAADEVQSAQKFGGGCGYWDGDGSVDGIATRLETGSWIVADVRTTSDLHRTASGLGVGSTLSELAAVYGDDLVVDRADGWESPTDGLLAYYQDVAAVADGDRAITYLLRDDVVERVKVGALEWWGDDEGCA